MISSLKNEPLAFGFQTRMAQENPDFYPNFDTEKSYF